MAMVATEHYSVLLHSTDGVGANNNTKQFNVNWSAVLPTHFKKYDLNAWFCSTDNSGNKLPFVTVTLDSIKSYLWDSKSSGSTSIIAFAECLSGVDGFNAYTNNHTGKASRIMIDYPTQNNLTISIRTMDGATHPTIVGDWVLWLDFTPIQ